MILGCLILGGVGIVLTYLGFLVWKKQKISLFHSYHYDKVSEKDKPAFCTVSGLGILCIGVGILLSCILLCLTNSVWSFLAFAAGFAVGLALLIYAGSKYNSH